MSDNIPHYANGISIIGIIDIPQWMKFLVIYPHEHIINIELYTLNK